MAGIDTIKKHLLSAIELVEKIDESLEDNRIRFWEKIGILSKLLKTSKAAQDFGALKVEVLDLDEDEKAELYRFFTDELDFHNDAVEEVVEQTFQFILSLSSLLDLVKPGD